jgi:hypothetical protein
MTAVKTQVGPETQAEHAPFSPLANLPRTNVEDAIKYVKDVLDAAVAALPGSYQPLDSDLTAISALTTTPFGRALLELANATALAALVDGFFLTPAEGNAAYQPLDADLTAIAALTTAAYGRGLLELADETALEALLDTLPNLTNIQGVAFTFGAYAATLLNTANEAAFKQAVNLEIGVDVQAHDADLSAIAALAPSNDDVIQRKGGAWTNRTTAQLIADLAALGTTFQPLDADLTTWAGLTPSANAQSLVTAANYAAMRALLDLEAGTDFLTPAAIAAAYQPLDSDLSAIAFLTTTAFGRSLLEAADAAALRTLAGLSANGQSLVTAANYAAMRALLDLEAGTDFYSIAGADAAFAAIGRNLTAGNGLTGGGTLAADRTFAVGAGTGITVNADDVALSSNSLTVAIPFIIDGAGSTITTGVKGDLPIPFNCTITGWTILADQSGSIVVDVWKDTYANFPPTVADTIAGSEKPTISTATKGQDLSLSTWTTAITAGDILRFNVDSVTSIQRATVLLHVLKT